MMQNIKSLLIRKLEKIFYFYIFNLKKKVLMYIYIHLLK